MRKFYLYAGYYEMYITDTPLGKPYSLISWHKSPEAAEEKAMKVHPDDSYFFKTDCLPEWHEHILEEFAWEGKEPKIAEIQGQEFYIF